MFKLSVHVSACQCMSVQEGNQEGMGRLVNYRYLSCVNQKLEGKSSRSCARVYLTLKSLAGIGVKLVLQASTVQNASFVC